MRENVENHVPTAGAGGERVPAGGHAWRPWVTQLILLAALIVAAVYIRKAHWVGDAVPDYACLGDTIAVHLCDDCAAAPSISASGVVLKDGTRVDSWMTVLQNELITPDYYYKVYSVNPATGGRTYLHDDAARTSLAVRVIVGSDERLVGRVATLRATWPDGAVREQSYRIAGHLTARELDEHQSDVNDERTFREGVLFAVVVGILGGCFSFFVRFAKGKFPWE